MYIAASNAMKAPSGSFVSQWHKHAQLHTFYTNARILIPVIVTFYDAKLQSAKTPVAAKPSGILRWPVPGFSQLFLSYFSLISQLFPENFPFPNHFSVISHLFRSYFTKISHFPTISQLFPTYFSFPDDTSHFSVRLPNYF